MDELGELEDTWRMSSTIPRAHGAPPAVEPPEDLRAMTELARFLEESGLRATLTDPAGKQMDLPLQAAEALKRAVAVLARGEAVRIEPSGRPLTTQQAAELLGVSRNTLVRLLDERELPYERLGRSRHRRLQLQDVLDYRDRKRLRRRRDLDELTRQATADGLNDMDSHAYEAALAEARKA